MTLNFEETNNANRFKSRVVLGLPERPKMLDLILKTKLVKTEAAAVRVLMTLAAVIFLTSIGIFISISRGPSGDVPPPLMIPGQEGGPQGQMMPGQQQGAPQGVPSAETAQPQVTPGYNN